VTLVEAREKKWAFLESARRKAGLSCRVLNARVSRPLPPEWPAQVDVLTSRALRLDRELLEELAGRMSPNGSFWLWAGEAAPELPEGWCVARELPLPGGARRRLLEARRAERI
jgi:16S rRNA G527 N7-methylase RsmG